MVRLSSALVAVAISSSVAFAYPGLSPRQWSTKNDLPAVCDTICQSLVLTRTDYPGCDHDLSCLCSPQYATAMERCIPCVAMYNPSAVPHPDRTLDQYKGDCAAALSYASVNPSTSTPRASLTASRSTRTSTVTITLTSSLASSVVQSTSTPPSPTSDPVTVTINNPAPSQSPTVQRSLGSPSSVTTSRTSTVTVVQGATGGAQRSGGSLLGVGVTGAVILCTIFML